MSGQVILFRDFVDTGAGVVVKRMQADNGVIQLAVNFHEIKIKIIRVHYNGLGSGVNLCRNGADCQI